MYKGFNMPRINTVKIATLSFFGFLFAMWISVRLVYRPVTRHTLYVNGNDNGDKQRLLPASPKYQSLAQQPTQQMPVQHGIEAPFAHRVVRPMSRVPGTIYLVCEVKSGLGEDTFWTWFEREFPRTRFIPRPIVPPEYRAGVDVILNYSTMGAVQNPHHKQYIAFCLAWELLPEMKVYLRSSEWDAKIATTHACARTCDETLLASHLAKPYYEGIARRMDIMHLGVDTQVFRPVKNIQTKMDIRQRYGIPEDARVAYWGGTNHYMKGFDRLVWYAKSHPTTFFIIVWKEHSQEGDVPVHIMHRAFTHLKQREINTLMNAADFFLCTSRLRPYYMTEVEAMASDLPFVFTETLEKDFTPSGHPRNDIFKHGWDRTSVKERWITLFGIYGLNVAE